MTLAANRDDLSEDAREEDRSPDWHIDLLRERLERDEHGVAVWRSVDETFDRIRNQITNGRFNSQTPIENGKKAAALQPRIR